ncbi:MAG: hypothetical protein H6Q41_26 [Deltaproteobacteria bacterium]|jgi:CelD/BcsL family acetyltransferase involved in cellulose biosynthesis|nr:hypothetical protein [Deltaproteobacteria bacterium]
MEIRVIDTEERLSSIEKDWNDLLAKKGKASFFSSFDYVRLAWSHFRRTSDRLFVLVLREGDAVIGIAPLRISRTLSWGIPMRTVEFIATWEGDRPEIVTLEDEDLVWGRLYEFLSTEFRGWDVIDLVEQAVDSPGNLRWKFFQDKRFFCRVIPDSTCYYISLIGDWESYINRINAKVRSNWRNRAKRLRGLPEICRIECIENEDEVLEGLKRFIGIEQSGWKQGANLGIARDLMHKTFYEDLVVDLSRKNQVAIYLLKLGDKDIAGSVMYKFGGVQYERHIAYHPEYAAYSPGIILRTEILKSLFGTNYDECDLLGFRSNGDGQQHKLDWATGKRETVRTIVYRRKSRITPILLARRIEAWLKTHPSLKVHQ